MVFSRRIGDASFDRAPCAPQAPRNEPCRARDEALRERGATGYPAAVNTPTAPRENPDRSFATLLVASWGACVLVSALGTLPNFAYPTYVLYRVVLTIACLACSLPLLIVCRWLYAHAAIGRALAAALTFAYVLAYLSAVGSEQFERWLDPPGMTAKSIWFESLSGAIGAWALLGGIVGLYFGFRYYTAAQEAREHLIAATALAREAELRALRYQIQPHFVFNTLNAISTLVYTQQTADATRMIARFGDFLRLTLDADVTREVSVAEELELTLGYLDIERVRLGDRLDVRPDVDPASLDLGMPPLLLQPLVENAIRHGIAPSRRACRLDIAIRRDGERLVLTVANDGADLVEPVRYGVGLSNVAGRLRHLYDDDFRLVLSRPPGGGCAARVELPARPIAAERDA